MLNKVCNSITIDIHWLISSLKGDNHKVNLLSNICGWLMANKIIIALYNNQEICIRVPARHWLDACIGVEVVYPVIGGVYHAGQLLRAQLTLVILKCPSFKMKMQHIETLSIDQTLFLYLYSAVWNSHHHRKALNIWIGLYSENFKVVNQNDESALTLVSNIKPIKLNDAFWK